MGQNVAVNKTAYTLLSRESNITCVPRAHIVSRLIIEALYHRAVDTDKFYPIIPTEIDKHVS